MVHQFVVGSTQHGVTGVHAPTCLVNHALRVFDAHADGEGFGLHGHAVSVQHGETVAGTVAQSHHHMVCIQGVTLTAFLLQYVQRLYVALCAPRFI